MVGRRERRERHFYPRINPIYMDWFETEGKFCRRYRFDKGTVREVAEGFSNSQFAPKGMRSGGALSSEERVSDNRFV